MTTQTEALKLALEALEEIHVGNMTPMAEANWNKAITAIKEALAQQSNEQVEPVASCNGMPVYEGELSKTQRKQLMQDFDAPLTLNGVALYPLSKEPVGEVILYTGDGFPCAPFHQVKWRDGMMPPDGTKLYTHPPVPTAQPKDPEQEPVAYRYTDITEPELGFWFDEEPSDLSYLKCEPLYTTPPQRKPLTDEHPLMVFAKECVLGAYQEYELADAANKAIEAADKILKDKT